MYKENFNPYKLYSVNQRKKNSKKFMIFLDKSLHVKDI